MSCHLAYLQLRVPGLALPDLATVLGLRSCETNVPYDDAGRDGFSPCLGSAAGWLLGADAQFFLELGTGDLGSLMEAVTSPGGEASYLLQVDHSGSYGIDHWVDGRSVRSCLWTAGGWHRNEGGPLPEEDGLTDPSDDPEDWAFELYATLGPGWDAYAACEWQLHEGISP